jgi:hypothetical protein
MRFGIIGSRSFCDKEKLNRTLSFFIKNKDDVVVSGGATGADKMAVEWAKEKGFGIKEHLPEYDKYSGSSMYEEIIWQRFIKDKSCLTFKLKENKI